MTRSWSLRRAGVRDAPGLARCMKLAYAPYQTRMGDAPLPPMEADYRDELRRFPVWVAESDGDIVGGLIMLFEDDAATLANIAVHPEVQGRGVGGGLMKVAESVAAEKGYSELWLSTHVLLTENVSLYHHLGWTVVERDGARIRMMKTLQPRLDSG